MTTPRRRWFRFSLRTMLVGVVIVSVGIAAWALRQYCLVRERIAVSKFSHGRRAMQIGWPVFIDGRPTPAHFEVSRFHRWLGDSTWEECIVPDEWSDAEFQRIRAAFPESRVVKSADWIANFQAKHPIDALHEMAAEPRQGVEQIEEKSDNGQPDQP